MGRTLLIARREYFAYAKTVGFWLSLLALPIFASLGGLIPLMIDRSEPVRAIALVEQPGGEGVAAAVREAVALEQARDRASALRSAAVTEAGVPRADQVRVIAERNGYEAGLAELRRVAPRAAAGFEPPRSDVRLIEPPAAIASAAAGAREAAIRATLAAEEGGPDAVALLERRDGAPASVVWVRKASDRTAEYALRDALTEVNRRESLARAGVDPALVQSVERFRPEVQLYSPDSISGAEVSFRDRLPGIIGMGLGFVLWSLIITGASILMNSVMEEKANKVLEVLLSSASATELMIGKVLGVAFLTLTVLLVWGGLGIGSLAAFQPDATRDVLSVLGQGGLLIYLVLYLVGGYLMYAVLFTAIGAFCETPRDAQTLMGPIMMILVVPLLVMQLAVRTPDAPVVKILSWVPLFTPFLMTARAPSEPPLVEVLGTMAGMVAMVAVMIWLSGRAFRAGALSDVKLSWKSFAGAMTGR